MGVDDTVAQTNCGVFLWSRWLEVFDSVWVRCGFTVPQPKNAVVFYFRAPFVPQEGDGAVYQFDKWWLLVGRG